MNNDRSIFSFVSPMSNDKLSSLNGNDLLEFINLLNRYYLEYRELLNLDPSIEFGIELEFERANKTEIKNKLYEKFPDIKWKLVNEAMLFSTKGAEVNSPILNNNYETWNELKEVCEILKKQSVIDSRSAAHIHIGAHIMGKERKTWLNFLKFWSTYENIICRFCYGEYLTPRCTFHYYSSPCGHMCFQIYEYLKNNNRDLISYFKNAFEDCNRTLSLAYVKDLENEKYKNTMEFRCPNGTLNPIICQNNINLFASIVNYCKSDNYDEDIINARLNKVYNYLDNIDCYNEIFLEQALELSDILFNNNLDKIYFLRQYLKSYEVGNELFQHAKTFTLSA